MTTISVRVMPLLICLSAWPLMVGLTGCAGERHHQSTDQRIDDSRTAARVREALAAAPEYKFDGVQVAAFEGVVQLNGFVNTVAQKNSAGEVASKAVGVKDVVNNITVTE